jgi:hypothetical protein
MWLIGPTTLKLHQHLYLLTGCVRDATGYLLSKTRRTTCTAMINSSTRNSTCHGPTSHPSSKAQRCTRVASLLVPDFFSSAPRNPTRVGTRMSCAAWTGRSTDKNPAEAGSQFLAHAPKPTSSASIARATSPVCAKENGRTRQACGGELLLRRRVAALPNRNLFDRAK